MPDDPPPVPRTPQPAAYCPYGRPQPCPDPPEDCDCAQDQLADLMEFA